MCRRSATAERGDDNKLGVASMSGLGIFDAVKLDMNAVEGSSDETDVTVRLKEKNWYKLSAGTRVSTDRSDVVR